MTASPSHVASTRDIRNILEHESLKNAEIRNGSVFVLSPPTVSNSTVANYKALASVSSKAQIVNTSQQKTDNRHTAENSVMSTIAFLFTVATTHLFVGERLVSSYDKR